MAIEIERKFLVKGDYSSGEREAVRITQGYLNVDKDRCVRVRVWADKGYITVKSSRSGISRFEWEKEIPLEEARQLLELCSGVIDKTRHLVDYCGHCFEVDEFHGDNEGLTVAEVELESPDEEFERPEWLGEEVSYDSRYFNSRLIANPYKNWR